MDELFDSVRPADEPDWAYGLGNHRGVRQALDEGHALLQEFDPPANPGHRFVVDPDKFDFDAMDCYRVLRSAAWSWPERRGSGTRTVAEARIALGCVTACNGDLENAVVHGTRAFGGDRRCLPSLLYVVGELDAQFRERYAGTPQAKAFHDRLRALRAWSGRSGSGWANTAVPKWHVSSAMTSGSGATPPRRPRC